ncbi:hypothetical protein V8G57_08840 [Collimonas sp. H4R21]|uniref:Uncharacterized protein n=1 Tax=Collimonas rhizosphaerae TaxID=3126357 RepID=A0ABU9PU05_9BURK
MVKKAPLVEENEWMSALVELQLAGWATDLAALLRTDQPIPPIVRSYLAALIEGKVQPPDLRGKKNNVLSPTEKEDISTALFGLYLQTEEVLIFAEELADERGEEVIDIRHRMEKARRDGIKKIAEKYDISENTVRTYHEAKNTINWAHCFAGKNSIRASNGMITSELLGDLSELQRSALVRARGVLQYPELLLTI